MTNYQKSKEKLAQEYAQNLSEVAIELGWELNDGEMQVARKAFADGYFAAQDEKAELKTELLILNKKLEQIGSSYLSAKDEIKLLRAKLEKAYKIYRSMANYGDSNTFCAAMDEWESSVNAITLETIRELSGEE